MARHISDTNREIIKRVRALYAGQFVHVSDSTGSRQDIKMLLYHSQTKPFKELGNENLPPLNEYRLFEWQKSLYVARMT